MSGQNRGYFKREMENYSEIIIKLIDFCNMNCIMCGQISQSDNKRIIRLTYLKKYFKNKDISEKRIYLWGGEPLLHPELKEIIEFFKQKKSFVTINTNGFQLYDNLEYFARQQVDRIILSLDGKDGTTHDRVRGTVGSFKIVQNCISSLRKMKKYYNLPLLRINFVVLPDNYKQILDVLDWCNAQGVHKIHFQLPIFLLNNQIASYANLLNNTYSIKVKNYTAFLNDFQGIDFRELSRIMLRVYKNHCNFARFYPFEYLRTEELKNYFFSDHIIRNCSCDVIKDKLAIDSSGHFVTCPDFPDIYYGNLSLGITHPERLSWLKERFIAKKYLPICSRCCHFVPNQNSTL